MSKDQTVLVVDKSAETHEVLETVLARRGVRTYYARRVQEGLALADRLHPDLIVLDLELDEAGPEAIRAPFATQSRQNETPLVMLGTLRRGEGASSLGEFVRKPYDYGPLVRKIEELLVATDSAGTSGS